MRFDPNRVPTQTQLMLEKLVKDGAIDASAIQQAQLAKGIVRLLNQYIQQVQVLDDDALQMIVKLDLDEEKYKHRVFKNLAKESEIPIFGDALDALNASIEAYLWDSDDVEEIFADSRQLVALITPFLKAMSTKQTPR